MGKPSIHFCFVLVSGGNDLYPEMSYISISLARRANPGARVTILTDEFTPNTLTDVNRSVLDLADKVTVVATGLDDVRARSRYVKTMMRQAMDPGPFIYLDADALVLRDISGLISPDVVLAGVEDRNHPQPYPHFPTWVIPCYKRYCWSYPVRHYFNSGVLYINDTPLTHEVGRLWHARWRSAYEEMAIYQDQPSLNSALFDLDVPVKVVSTRYNAMVDAAPWLCRDAAIFHYFASVGTPRFKYTLLGQLMEHRRSTGCILWEAVERATRDSDPWVHPTESVLFEFYTGHKRSALRLVAIRTFNGQYIFRCVSILLAVMWRVPLRIAQLAIRFMGRIE